MRTLCGLALALVACSSAPKYRIDDQVLASIPLADKQAVMNAQNEQNQTREEVRKAKADVDAVEHEADIADNEYKAAKLGRDTAEVSKKAADQSGDLNRKNAAERDLHVAGLGVKAASAKLDFLSKKRKWLRAALDAAEQHLSACDAQVELEKAKLAQQKGIKPSEDFNVTNFETESLEKSRKYSEARRDADGRKADVDDLERKWTSMNEEYTQAKNIAH